MKNNSSSWLTILITAVVGILLIVWHSRIDLLQWLIVAMGLVLLIPGVYNLIVSVGSKARAEGTPISAIVAAIGAAGLGLWMIISPTFFVGLMAYLFAALMIVYGIMQLLMVSVWSRPYVLSWWFYLVPVILIVAGMVILCSTVRDMNNVVVLMTGIMLIASAINWALTIVATNPSRIKESEVRKEDSAS